MTEETIWPQYDYSSEAPTPSIVISGKESNGYHGLPLFISMLYCLYYIVIKANDYSDVFVLNCGKCRQPVATCRCAKYRLRDE